MSETPATPLAGEPSPDRAVAPALQIAAEASALIGAALDPEATLRQVTELAVPRLADLCTIHMLTEAGQIAQLAVTHRDPASAAFVWELERQYPLDPASAIGVPQVIRTGAPEIVPLIDTERITRYTEEERQRSLLQSLHLRSALLLPLVARGRTLGAISLYLTHAGRSYSAADLPTAEALARPAALAIDNARLYAAERAARAAAEAAVDRLQRLQAITAALGEALTPSDVAQVVVDHALRALGARAGSIRQLAPDGSTLQAVRMKGYSEEVAGAWNSVPLDLRTPLTDAFRSGAPIFASSIEEIAALYPDQAAAAQSTGFQSFATLPLVVEGRVIGAMNLSFPDPRQFTDDDRAFMQVLAQQCAQALERGRRYEAERVARAAAERAGDRLALLADASVVLSSSLDYAATLRRIADLAVPRLADMCRVVMRGDTGIEQVGLAAAPPYLAVARALLAEYPFDPDDLYGESLVLRSGEPLLVSPIDMAGVLAGARDDRHRELLQKLDLLGYMIVPLSVRGQTIGALTFVSTSYMYGADDLKLAEDLARRIAIAVDNARLYREAQNAIRLRDVFLSIASHELNTPITSLLGFSDILYRQVQQDSDASPRDRLIAGTINEQAIRLQKLTAMLLDVSRIQTDQLALERSEVDLCALVGGVADQLQSTTGRHRITTTCPPGMVIEADELRLEQVLYNLIQNAIKYSPEGGTVDVRVQAEPSHVVIEVRDEGVGIPAAEVGQLFSRFYRGSNVDPRRISGMGLGLFIVKQIVELHGGTVKAESREGTGSTFRVRLPRARREG